MPNQLRIMLLVCIQDYGTRDRLMQHLRDAEGRGIHPCAQNVSEISSLEKVAEELRPWYRQSESCGAILLSDQLAQTSEPNSSARALFDEFGEELYATIAVMERTQKILDIDRVIEPDCSQVQFRDILNLCADRLNYLRRPARKPERFPVEVRFLKREFEFLEYFRLRYQVYRPMSYLDLSVEEAPSRMEIDWFDKKSIHIGAFEQGPNGLEKLIGTARLITTKSIKKFHEQMTITIAGRDEVLDDVVRNGAVMWMLPVFQSRPEMIDQIRDAGLRGVMFGELSRVIVHPDYRGTGLSRRLCQFVTSTARDSDVHTLFLECLPIHEGLYRSVGFEACSKPGKVYGIDRSMIVMHLPMRTDAALQPAQAVSPAEGVSRV